MEVINKTLEDLNSEKVQRFTPAIVFIVIMMCLGIFGNSAVLFTYAFKIKRRSTYRLFVLMLAAVDMTASCAGMPGLLVHLTRVYNFNSNSGCKLLQYGYSVVIMASALTHLLIGLERHRKICRPLRKQMSIMLAETFLFLIVIVSLLGCIPSLMVYGKLSIVLKNTNLTLSLCHVDQYYVKTSYPLVYDSAQLLLLVLDVSVLFLCYILIARQLCKSSNTVHALNNRWKSTIMSRNVANRRKETIQKLDPSVAFSVGYNKEANKETVRWNHRASARRSASLTNCTGTDSNLCSSTYAPETNNDQTTTVTNGKTYECGNDISEIPKSSCKYKGTSVVKPNRFKDVHMNQREYPIANAVQKRLTAQSIISKRSEQNSRLIGKHSRKVTAVSFVITFIFVVSYLPHFSLAIAAAATYNHSWGMSPGQEGWYKIASLSYVINSALNPYVYFIMDKDFKTCCHKLLTKLRAKFSK